MKHNLLASKQASRILWLDVLKGTLIILMVFGHNIQFGSGQLVISSQLYFKNTFFRLIYSFHMPCLMMVSGYFFRFSVDKPYFWKRRVENILIPTIVWSMIYVGVSLLKAIYNRRLNLSLIYSCFYIIITYFWFLWALLFCSLIVRIIHIKLNDNGFVYTGLGILLLFVPNVLNTKLWIYMYPFFVVGYLWNLKKVDIRWEKNHKYIVAGTLVVAFATLFVFYNTDSFIYTTGITVRSFSQLGIDLYRYAIGFIGSAMVSWVVYIICPKLNEKIKNVLAYCGRVSLTIYIVDSLLNSYVLTKLTICFSLNYGIVLCETIVVIPFCLFFDFIIRKIPFARAILLGNR